MAQRGAAVLDGAAKDRVDRDPGRRPAPRVRRSPPDRRRVHLPELALGVLAVAGGGLGAVLWSADEPSQRVLVAARPIQRGESLDASMLRWARILGPRHHRPARCGRGQARTTRRSPSAGVWPRPSLAGAPQQPGQVQPGGGGEPAVAAGRAVVDRPLVRAAAASRVAEPLLHPGQGGPVQRGLAEEAQRRRTPRRRARARARRRRSGARPGRCRPASPARAPAPRSRRSGSGCASASVAVARRGRRCRRASAHRRPRAAGWRRSARPGPSVGTSPGWPSPRREHQRRAGPAGWPGTPGAGRRRRRSTSSASVRRRASGRRRGPPGRAPRRRRTPPASRRAAGRCARSRAAGSASSRASRTRAAPAVPSPSTTQVQPKPLAMRTPSGGSCAAHQASATSTLARSARAIARHSGWPVAADVLRRTRRPSAAYHAACAARGRVRLTGLAQPVGGVRPDAVEQPVAHLAVVGAVHADQRPVDQPADGVQRPTPAGTPSAARTCSTASSEALPAKQDSAHSPRWSSGKSRS